MEMTTLDAGLASTTNTASPPTESPAAPRPTSWEDAFAQAETSEARDAAPPATQPPVQDGSAPPIAEPPKVETQEAPAPETKEGPIPFKAHKTALENARVKAREEGREEAEQTFRQQYAPALDIYQALERDTPGTLIQLLDEAMTIPAYAQAITSHAARTLAAQRASGKADPMLSPETEPEPDLEMADGTRLYSEKQLKAREQWMQKQWRQSLDADLQPVMNLSQQIEQVKAQQAQTREWVEQHKPLIAEWQQMPGFREHREAIVKRQAELFETALRGGQRPNHLALLARAYREIVPATWQAQAQQQIQQQQQQLTASAVAKATGRTENPAATAPAPPRRPRSFDEAFERAFDGYQG